MGYDFTIEYKKGAENSAAVALSRLPPAMEFGFLSVVGGINTAVFVNQVKEDETLNGILQALLNNQMAHATYVVSGELLTYHDRLVLPANSPTTPLLLDEFHNSPVGGHQGALKTYQQLSREVYWTRVKARIRVFLPKCAIC